MKFLIMIMLISISFVIGCSKQTLARPVEDVQPIAPDPAISEREELVRKLKNYPVVIAVDNSPEYQEKEMDQKSLVFTMLHQALDDTFTIYDSVEQEESLKREMKARGIAASSIPEDYLFAKYNRADVCVYVWCEIEQLDSNVNRWALSPRISCRVVDMHTKQQLARSEDSISKVPFDQGTLEESKRKAVLALLDESEPEKKSVDQKLVPTLKRQLDQHLADIINQSFRIKGTLTSEKDQIAMRNLINKMEAQNHIIIKAIVKEGAIFEYEVLPGQGKDESSLSKLMQELAEVDGFIIKVRSARRTLDVQAGSSAEF